MAPRRRSQPGKFLPQTTTLSIEMGSEQDLAFGWEPWTAPALEELLPQLSVEEQLRVHNYLRQYPADRTPSLHSEGERDFNIIHHVRYALHHYNAKHPGEKFDVVKPLMGSSASFRDQMWYHVNFWARCRKTKKIKRFFAEVHYKALFSSSVRSPPVPGAEKPPSSSSVCSHLPRLVMIPVVEACTIIEEPLGRNKKSCAFCSGYLDILHPKGRKFVCGNDKDRMVQRIIPCGGSPMGLKMPFTCRHEQEED